MRRLIQATALCLALAVPASADILYQGRDAQGLHCAAMLTIVSAMLYKDGQITEAEYNLGIKGAANTLSQLPGTKNQKLQALRQRGVEIIRTRSPDELAKEYTSTIKWCNREFLS